MFAGKLCGLDAPDECGADSLNLVCGYLFAIARTTENDS
jgi:hypothetical protein